MTTRRVYRGAVKLILFRHCPSKIFWKWNIWYMNIQYKNDWYRLQTLRNPVIAFRHCVNLVSSSIYPSEVKGLHTYILVFDKPLAWLYWYTGSATATASPKMSIFVKLKALSKMLIMLYVRRHNNSNPLYSISLPPISFKLFLFLFLSFLSCPAHSTQNRVLVRVPHDLLCQY